MRYNNYEHVILVIELYYSTYPRPGTHTIPDCSRAGLRYAQAVHGQCSQTDPSWWKSPGGHSLHQTNIVMTPSSRLEITCGDRVIIARRSSRTSSGTMQTDGTRAAASFRGVRRRSDAIGRSHSRLPWAHMANCSASYLGGNL